MYIFLFILALILGSFLNVVIYRLPKNKSIITPPSHCPECGTRLKPWDLVPILSFLFNQGKCRYCGTSISWQYPVVELLTALLFTAIYLKYENITEIVIYMLLVSLLIVVSFIDLRYKKIPNKITYPGIVTGILLASFFNHITLINSLLGIVIPGGFLLLIALIFKKGMGMGDVKLVALIGSFTGWQDSLLGILFGSFLGSIIGIILLIAGITSKKTKIPFGPYLSIGTVIAIFWGDFILNWYLALF